MLYNRCTGIYKFGNNTYPRRIRRGSNLGHILRGKKVRLMGREIRYITPVMMKERKTEWMNEWWTNEYDAHQRKSVPVPPLSLQITLYSATCRIRWSGLSMDYAICRIHHLVLSLHWNIHRKHLLVLSQNCDSCRKHQPFLSLDHVICRMYLQYISNIQQLTHWHTSFLNMAY